MRSLLLLFMSLMTISLVAQETEIAGAYYQSSGNPEGGAHFVIMPNHHFIVMYFGGMRKGTWEQTGKQYKFTYHTEPKFALYARYNPSVKDSIKIDFSVDANLGYAVRFNGGDADAFTPIFNEGANCFSYPYTITQNQLLQKLEAFAPNLQPYYDGEIKQSLSQVYRFIELKTYNEFMLKGLPSSYSQAGSFTAIFEQGDLVVNQGERMKKRSAYNDISEEDLKFIKQITEKEMLPNTLNYGDAFFPYYDTPSETDRIPFTRLNAVITNTEKENVLPQSLFEVTCEE